MKRYAFIEGEYGIGSRIDEVPSGPYILHSDHAAEVARLTAANARLEATNADLCFAICHDPLLGQKLGIDLANTVRTAAHEAAIAINAQASADATKLEEERDAALAALEGVKLDAARYRWLREQDGSKGWYTVCGAVFGACRMGLMDDRIDAQLSALPADGGGEL